MQLTKTKPHVVGYNMRFTEKNDPDMYYRCLWAKITLDMDNWTLSAITDCGDYQYHRPAEDKQSFLEFLLELNSTDLLQKIAKNDRFNLDESKAATIAQLIEHQEIKPDDPRLNAIKYIDECYSEERFIILSIEECDLVDDCDDVVVINDYSPGAHTFVEIFEKYLKPQLIKDINEYEIKKIWQEGIDKITTRDENGLYPFQKDMIRRH